ncbi:MAG: hypothetical protein ABSA46_06490 [Thermodesulfovibrionales bacterium]|jgi:hypothetical protein
MRRFVMVLLGFTLLLPRASDAAYKIYLKNGSVIAGAASYEKNGDEIMVQFGGGSIGVPAKDVLKIEQTDLPEKDLRSPATPEKQGESPSSPAVPTPGENQTTKQDELKNELESIDTELQSVQDKETQLTDTIKEKQEGRTKYKSFQLKNLEEELEPIRQELFATQQRKSELLQRKASVEDELRALR